jgi:hydroxyethylthiazole kinase-like uncharacterized protein yjeF
VVYEVEPEDVLGVGRVQAWAVGPGIGTGDAAATVVEQVLGTGLPVVLDADALTVVAARRPRLHDSVLLTPHEGEFARFEGTGDPTADRIGAVRNLAARLGATVLLKGSTTVIASPDGRVRVSASGTSRMAAAGSGDVLTGLCGSLLAQGVAPLEAGAAGAFLHGLAGRLASDGGAVPISASDILAGLPHALRAVAGRPQRSPSV